MFIQLKEMAALVIKRNVGSVALGSDDPMVSFRHVLGSVRAFRYGYGSVVLVDRVISSFCCIRSM